MTTPIADTFPIWTVVGADYLGGPRLIVTAEDGTQLFDFFAYDETQRFGVYGTTGDIDGDGTLDIITIPRQGGSARIRVYSGRDLTLIRDFFAFEESFRGGGVVSSGDIDGDGRADILVAAGESGGPRIQVFSGRDGTLLKDFFAFDPAQRGGVRLAAADFNDDGRMDIVASAGPNSGNLVRVFDAMTDEVRLEFAAYTPDFQGGAWVTVGDCDNDGLLDIVTGAGTGGGPHVKVFDGRTGLLKQSFFAYEPDFRGGVRVQLSNAGGELHDDLRTGAGFGGGPRVRMLCFGESTTLLDEFYFEPTFRGGITVG